MGFDLTWLLGRKLVKVEKKDFTWFFVLDDSGSVCTESDWRLFKERVAVTSQDHEQMFGLALPVNAGENASNLIGESVIEKISVDEQTGDLSIRSNNGSTIQFVTLSSGYEGWRIGGNGESIICLGGGELAKFGPK